MLSNFSATNKNKDILEEDSYNSNPQLITNKMDKIGSLNLGNDLLNKTVPLFDDGINSKPNDIDVDINDIIDNSKIDNISQNKTLTDNDVNDINFNFDEISIEISDNEFNLYDKNKSKLGSFSINDIINNILNIVKPDISVLNSKNKNIIDNLIGNLNLDDGIINFNLKNYKNSIFMKNLELLMFLNHKLHNIQRTGMINQLYEKSFNFSDTTLLKNVIDRFIYNIILKTLELISVISNKIKNNENSDGLKKVLIQYTVGLTFRLSQYVNSTIENMTTKIKNLNDNKKKSDNLKEMIGGKMDDLILKVNRQNKILDKYYKIIKKIKKKR